MTLLMHGGLMHYDCWLADSLKRRTDALERLAVALDLRADALERRLDVSGRRVDASEPNFIYHLVPLPGNRNMVQTRNSDNNNPPDPIATQLAAIAAKLEAIETMKEDIAALKEGERV
ncbi:hypothetical protein Tco_0571142 [Tanacetum coccineum]